MARLPELPSTAGGIIGTVGVKLASDRMPQIQTILCGNDRMVSDATEMVSRGLSLSEAAKHVLLRCQSAISSPEAIIGLITGSLAGALVLAVESFKQPENKPEPEWWKSIQKWHPWTKNIVPTFKALRTASAVAAPLLFIHFIQATDYLINGQPTSGEVLVNLLGAGGLALGGGTIFKRGYDAYKMNSQRIKSGVNSVREIVTEATDDIRAEVVRRQSRDEERQRILGLVRRYRNGYTPPNETDRAKVEKLLRDANDTTLSGMMETYVEYHGREEARVLAGINDEANKIETELEAKKRPRLPKSPPSGSRSDYDELPFFLRKRR